MTDIVERLRNVFPIGWEGEMRHEAADEIERLRLIINTVHPQMQLQIDALTAERDDWVEQARKAMDDAEAREAAAWREGIEAAASIADGRPSDRGEDIAAAIRALLEDGR